MLVCTLAKWHLGVVIIVVLAYLEQSSLRTSVRLLEFELALLVRINLLSTTYTIASLLARLQEVLAQACTLQLEAIFDQ